MPNVGPWEIVLLLFLAMLLFGAKRLPEIGRSVGQGMREFKNSVSNHTAEIQSYTEEVRAEVDDLRESVATTDVRSELALPSLREAVTPAPAAKRKTG
jgi:sec-independent protein translocase protein TatA